MAEYISRDEVLEHSEYTGNFNLVVPVRFIKAIKAADVQPVEWISVDDRLPNINERVLVYIPRPDNHYNIEIAYISEGNDDYPYWVLRDKSQFYSTRFHYISRWMPMPEPPKDGDAE